MEPEGAVLQWLGDRDVPPHIVRRVADLFEAGVAEARLALVTVTPSLRVRLFDEEAGRLTLLDLLRAAREDRLDRLEVR